MASAQPPRNVLGISLCLERNETELLSDQPQSACSPLYLERCKIFAVFLDPTRIGIMTAQKRPWLWGASLDDQNCKRPFSSAHPASSPSFSQYVEPPIPRLGSIEDYQWNGIVKLTKHGNKGTHHVVVTIATIFIPRTPIQHIGLTAINLEMAMGIHKHVNLLAMFQVMNWRQ